MDAEDGLEAILLAAGIDNSSEWLISISRFRDQDKGIMISENGGLAPEVKIPIDYPTVQILVRGGKGGYAAAKAKAREIFNLLHAIDSAPAEYPELTSCRAKHQPIFVGYDRETERPIFSLNFNIIATVPTTTNRDL